MDKTILKKGTRIYYSGDQANEEGLGVITRQTTDEFGTTVNISMDDGRGLVSIPITMFSDEYLGHGGTRFVTEEAYMDFRQAQIDKVKATLVKRDAERSISDEELTEEGTAIYAIRPLTDQLLVKIATGKIDMKRLAQLECTRREIGGKTSVSDERLNELLEDASREAEKRGESDTEPKLVRANQLKLGDVLKNGTGAILLAKREDFHNGLFFMVLCLVPSKSEFVTWGMNEDGVTFNGRYFFNISEAALDFDKR